MLLLLVVGPPMEEKYGSIPLLKGILFTALVTGALQCLSLIHISSGSTLRKNLLSSATCTASSRVAGRVSRPSPSASAASNRLRFTGGLSLIHI